MWFSCKWVPVKLYTVLKMTVPRLRDEQSLWDNTIFQQTDIGRCCSSLLINKSELKCTFLKDIHWVVQTLCNTVYMYISYRPCVTTSILHCAMGQCFSAKQKLHDISSSTSSIIHVSTCTSWKLRVALLRFSLSLICY